MYGTGRIHGKRELAGHVFTLSCWLDTCRMGADGPKRLAN